jgi:hypothetical protein
MGFDIMKKLFKKNNLNFDLEEFIANIDKQYIEYRNTLNLNNSVTFGVEIEFEKTIPELNNNKGVVVDVDKTSGYQRVKGLLK